MRQLALLSCLAAFQFAPAISAQDSELLSVMQQSEDAWNRGDLPAFAAFYEDSPKTTFIGREVVRGGTQAILKRYQTSYPNRAAMGTLAFSELTVRQLGAGFALVDGKFHLTRTSAGGGDASGRFTLIFHKTPSGWKIIHDHTSAN